MRFAVAEGYPFCITMDAGLSHDPDVIPRFQEHTDADLVIGYREETVNVPGYRRGLSWGARTLMNLALVPRFVPWGGAGLRDVTSGYRMYARDAFSLLVNAKMKSQTFDFHLESLAYVYRAGMVDQGDPDPLRVHELFPAPRQSCGTRFAPAAGSGSPIWSDPDRSQRRCSPVGRGRLLDDSVVAEPANDGDGGPSAQRAEGGLGTGREHRVLRRRAPPAFPPASSTAAAGKKSDAPAAAPRSTPRSVSGRDQRGSAAPASTTRPGSISLTTISGPPLPMPRAAQTSPARSPTAVAAPVRGTQARATTRKSAVANMT